jgi:hypothetical protein
VGKNLVANECREEVDKGGKLDSARGRRFIWKQQSTINGSVNSSVKV